MDSGQITRSGVQHPLDPSMSFNKKYMSSQTSTNSLQNACSLYKHTLENRLGFCIYKIHAIILKKSLSHSWSKSPDWNLRGLPWLPDRYPAHLQPVFRRTFNGQNKSRTLGSCVWGYSFKSQMRFGYFASEMDESERLRRDSERA